ncbi:MULTISPECIES: hypothetical protein [Cupriavidus]
MSQEKRTTYTRTLRIDFGEQSFSVRRFEVFRVRKASLLWERRIEQDRNLTLSHSHSHLLYIAAAPSSVRGGYCDMPADWALWGLARQVRDALSIIQEMDQRSLRRALWDAGKWGSSADTGLYVPMDIERAALAVANILHSPRDHRRKAAMRSSPFPDMDFEIAAIRICLLAALVAIDIALFMTSDSTYGVVAAVVRAATHFSDAQQLMGLSFGYQEAAAQKMGGKARWAEDVEYTVARRAVFTAFCDWYERANGNLGRGRAGFAREQQARFQDVITDPRTIAGWLGKWLNGTDFPEGAEEDATRLRRLLCRWSSA